MVNIFIDTNIFIRLITNNDDNKLFEELKVMIEEGIVKLLVPEIVILELEKQDRVAKDKIKEEFNCLNKNIKEVSKALWSEVRYISEKISNLIEEEKSYKLQMWDNNYEDVRRYLTSSSVEYIEFTPEIMCKGEKRIIAGKLVRANSNSSQDSYNIESLISYFEFLGKNEEDELIICSNDIKDFSAAKKGENGFYELHPNFKEKLPNTKCSQTLENLMKYINYGFEYIYKGNVEIKDNNIIDELSLFDNIDDENIYEDASINELKENVFIKLNFTQKELKEYRGKVIDNIKGILEKCRCLESWNDRSESKLYSWMENRTEEEIEISKLSDIILIRRSLEKYYNLHLEEL
ncbi:PIN domain-containing protein [Clostridium sp. NSJ-145]|uniref:PIN domain-containing protein n=1 Tax=Clostridium sp. NSJ-145 TaxID=2897777 RepID=UPI001E64274C|nr:PIN domain-containing protein [Clostridium sp. NSJ-145]MCD2500159.1 PIN domain-containing protein [Clostridium sp. NSJ-145]